MDYSKIQWGSIKRNGSSLIFIDVNQPNGIRSTDLDEELKQELLNADKYIEHSTNNYGPEDTVTIYEIKDRAIDNRGNLILFVESNYIRYPR